MKNNGESRVRLFCTKNMVKNSETFQTPSDGMAGGGRRLPRIVWIKYCLHARYTRQISRGVRSGTKPRLHIADAMHQLCETSGLRTAVRSSRTFPISQKIIVFTRMMEACLNP